MGPVCGSTCPTNGIQGHQASCHSHLCTDGCLPVLGKAAAAAVVLLGGNLGVGAELILHRRLGPLPSSSFVQTAPGMPSTSLFPRPHCFGVPGQNVGPPKGEFLSLEA